MKYKLIMNLEDGYRLEIYKDNGFVKDKIDIASEEITEVITDLCELSAGEDKDIMLDRLRLCDSLFRLKSIAMVKD